MERDNRKVIIFDLGGVIINLAVEQTLVKLGKLMGKDISDIEEAHFDNGIFVEFETGKIDSQTFRDRMRDISKDKFSNEAFDKVWNAMLKDIPKERMTWITDLKKEYRLVLLSNTNKIHIEAFNEIFKTQTPYNHPSECFDEIFYSFDLKDRKPNLSIYEKVLERLNTPSETIIFYDDKIENLESAKTLGIKTVLVPRNQLTKSLLPNENTAI